MAVTSFRAFLLKRSYYPYRRRANLRSRDKQPYFSGNEGDDGRRPARGSRSRAWSLSRRSSLKKWPGGVSTVSPTTAILQPADKSRNPALKAGARKATGLHREAAGLQNRRDRYSDGPVQPEARHREVPGDWGRVPRSPARYVRRGSGARGASKGGGCTNARVVDLGSGGLPAGAHSGRVEPAAGGRFLAVFSAQVATKEAVMRAVEEDRGGAAGLLRAGGIRRFRETAGGNPGQALVGEVPADGATGAGGSAQRLDSQVSDLEVAMRIAGRTRHDGLGEPEEG
jgi:hypothetical protein